MAVVAEKTEWTYQRMLQELPDESRYELIDSELIMAASPFYNHQKASHKIDRILSDFIEKHNLGEVLTAPFDVIFDENNVVQPDILFVSNENKSIIKNHIHGAPDLLIEIVSKSSIFDDYFKKKNLYEQNGVKEYWIIDPANETVIVFKLEKGVYVAHFEGSEEDTLTSHILKGLSISLKDIFPE